MKTIKVNVAWEVPKHFTGIAELTSGSKHWYLNDKRHRVDGPAWERADGSKQWWLNGQRHRTDGPAVEDADGSKQWWLNSEFSYKLERIRDYILIEDGLPSEVEWLGKRVTQRKLLTATGFMYIPNLPGI